QLPFIVQYALPPTGPTLHQFGPQRPGWQKQSAGAQGVTPVEGTVAGQYCPRGTCNKLAAPALRSGGGAVHQGVGNRLASDEGMRSEEHTSELQSRENLVCR